MEECDVCLALTDIAVDRLMSRLCDADEDIQEAVLDLFDCGMPTAFRIPNPSGDDLTGTMYRWSGVNWNVGYPWDWPAVYWIHDTVCMLSCDMFKYRITSQFSGVFIMGNLEV